MDVVTRGRRITPRTPVRWPSCRWSGSPRTSGRRVGCRGSRPRDMIDGIVEAVSNPEMATSLIEHFAETQMLQSLGVHSVDESELQTPVYYENHSPHSKPIPDHNHNWVKSPRGRTA